ncbi:MAG: hypothetical protein ISS82_03760 [Nanoarchaeota archaeon]|nr:hypothetical protein [Nanoarchaeota archaeon]
MKILLIVTGLGYGDSIRAEAIITKIKKLKPKTEVLVMGYDNSYEYFKNKYETIKIKGYRFDQKGLKFRTGTFLFKNFHIPISWILNYRENKERLKKFDPDLIISDFEIFSNFLAKKLKKKCISIFAFDPELYNIYPNKTNNLSLQSKFLKKTYEISDKVIIPSFTKNKKVNNTYYINLIIREGNKKNKKEIIKKLGLKEEPILVMLGGSKYGLILANKINNIRNRFKENFIFFGGDFAFKENFLEYLKVSKGLITLAGNLTLSEGFFYKKPMLVYPIENHVEQLLNVYSIKKYIVIGNKNNVEEDLNKFLSSLNKLKKNMPTFKFDGAKQAAEIILKNYKN